MELWEQLQTAVNYAAETGSFHRKNSIEKAEHVCVYGLGKYFEEAFFRQRVRERFSVDMLCDGNSGKVDKVLQGSAYEGIKGITLAELGKLNSVYVIVMLGNPSEALTQIGELIGAQNCAAYNDVALDDVISAQDKYRNTTRFKKQQEDIFQAYDILEDEKSRWVYVNAICNRIAPQFSQATYEQMYQEPQYFPSELFTLTENERVVDGGAYTGDTCEAFLQACRGRFGVYHAFEMDRDNYEKLMKWRTGLEKTVQKKICCHQKGLWSKRERISYGRNATDDSYSIYNESDISYATTETIDDFLKDETVTLIKMDIEGAEMEALAGGARTIATQKPKMAICVYHRLEDMWRIPLYLKDLVPNYRIGMRHHAQHWVSETVCYAYL